MGITWTFYSALECRLKWATYYLECNIETFKSTFFKKAQTDVFKELLKGYTL